MMNRLRAWLVFLALLTVVIGLPVALAATIGNPLSAWPDIKAGDMSDRAVLAILAAVAWAAWATFAVAFAFEFLEALAAKLGGRAARLRRIPLLGFQQDLARTVLAAVFVLVPTVAGVISPTTKSMAAPTSASAAPVAVVSQHTAASTSTPAGQVTHSASNAKAAATTTYTIPAAGGMTTYWDLAEHYLGSGERWPEIWQLNDGHTQADGTAMDSPRLLIRGWTVLIPTATPTADAGSHDVIVEPGDTLSGLATEHGVHDWTQAWKANADRPEPNGMTFSNPDLIRPGWTITLPGRSVANPSPSYVPSTKVPRSHTAPSPTTQSPRPSTPTVLQSPEPVASAPGQASPAHASTAPGPAASAVRHGDDGSSLLTVFAAGGGVLLAGASLAALLRQRQRQFRWRTPGRTICSTPPELAAVEKSLRQTGVAAIADVTWLDHALRSLVHAMSTTPGSRLPDLVAARLTGDKLQLVLTTAHSSPPSPWTAEEDGLRWTLRRGDELGFDPGERAQHFAPYPTLSSVGYTEAGENWLIDLERVAAMSLVGNPDRCLNLARFLAAELSHNSWSEQLQVTLVGFGQEMAQLNPSRLSYTDDLSGAVSALSSQFAQIGDLAEEAGVDVLAGRLSNIAGDAWAPHVLLVAPNLASDRAELDTLLQSMRHRAARTAIALVLAEETEQVSATRWQLQLHDDGRVTVPALGIELIAQQLPAEEAAPLAELLALAASTDDEPMPEAHGDQPWDSFADAAGALLADIPTPTVVSVNGLDKTRSWASSTVLPLPTATYLEQTATTLPDIKTLVPAISDENRRRVEAADPRLEDDLAAWRDQASKRPKLRLLGAPLLTAHGALPSGRPRKDFYTEVVAFLATRSGATVEQLSTALWPNDPGMTTKTTPRQAVTIVRKWLGRNPDTGQAHLPYGGDGSITGTYRIEGLLVDAELVRRLRLRGVARGADGEGMADLIAALELVDGVPFDRCGIRARRSPSGPMVEPYSWLVDCPLDHEYRAMITDLAHLVATNLIPPGHAEKAAWAAQVALRAGDSSDVPLLDLVAAALAQDQPATAEQYVRRIMGNHDADVEEELPTRTYGVLRRLLRASKAAS